MKRFNGVKIPSGVGKAVRNVWYFELPDGRWTMRTKAVVINIFASKEEGLEWWKEFGEFRGRPDISWKMRKPPPLKPRLHKMGPAEKAPEKKICPVCNGGNISCNRCGGSGWVEIIYK